jgi:predicted phosphodiesterase
MKKNSMKKIIAIGDIHGSTYWIEIVKSNPNSCYIFLGDYLDPYTKIDEKALIDNLKAIIELKRQQPEDVILLLGNHDLHYFSSDIVRGSRYNWHLATEAKQLFLENSALFQNAFQRREMIFTHAGISQQWFDEDFKGDITRNIADTQIVGHTQVQEIQKIETNGGTIWFCDCLWDKQYLKL